ncbi:uncharacterized protein LOC103873529 [Brassica rapa]|uniref:DUF7950 domain-containing protein n=2 Tax=Brassica TaxID=3705 RepID=M4DSQ6_BRACM|nr:uncharacterized protein LOC103873529 [Brassica rapa]XP_022570835.1 uncharacterized protein LOC111213369 [Brassica napus]CAF2087137.1 unnamed protein product [Brassica napus]CDY37923.1 BnaA06g18940D [Brassica napus]
MLRFRPIAPKPTSDYGCGGKPVSSGESFSGSSNVSFRGKRKCQQTENGGSARRCTRRKKLEKTVAHGGEAKVTLSLLPERPGQSAFTDMKLSVASAEKQKRQGPFWLSLSDGGGMITQTYQSVEVMGRTVVISSCMTVERVTDAWNDGYGLGRSDEERKMNLVRDTCPGFISDGSGRVTWTNEAYRKMARDNIRVKEGAPENKSGESFHVIVRLVMRERPMLTYTAFTCRMTLQFTCQDRERCSVTVPCDVWRMDDGR